MIPDTASTTSPEPSQTLVRISRDSTCLSSSGCSWERDSSADPHSKKKIALVLEHTKYAYQKYCSDIAGQDVTPQHEGFNRDMFQYHGLWGQLENHIVKQAEFVDRRLVILAGPVLDTGDPKRDFGSGVKVQVPRVFWKIVVAMETTGSKRTLRAYGFRLDQTDAIEQYGWEGRFRVGKFKEQQVRIADLAAETRLTFPEAVLKADPLKDVADESSGKITLTDLERIRLK